MTARRCRSRSCTAKDLKRDGTAPLLLYGYGSYGMAMPASFSANRLSLVDRGFVYAIAHIRGGADKGWGWYLDGKREKKTNSFDDFAACARALIEANYTGAKRIVGHGGSAGGMLMGAVANRAGELFAGIVAEVPFVDVLNTMLDDTPAADAAGMAGMGQPDRKRKGFSHHPVLFALRQRRGEGLSGDPGDGRADRSARHLLGAGEMDRAAARHHDAAAARCCCAPTWAPATAARRAASTGSTRSRSPMRSRCGRWDWRRRARCEPRRVAEPAYAGAVDGRLSCRRSSGCDIRFA